jgi:TRAP-type C4-dicarboxylate transport system permease small subunit
MAMLMRLARWLLARAENVAAMLMAVMICSFLYQIAARYVFNISAPWAEEICVITWVWGILWCSAVVARPVDDIRIDLITVSVSPKARRVIEGLCSLILIVLFLIGLPGAWNYVSFMKVETTPAMGLRYHWVFSVYILFAVAVVVRQAWSLWQAFKGSGNQQFAEGREAAEL